MSALKVQRVMGLVYGCYQRSPDKLTCVLTDQQLQLVAENKSAATFEYVDAESSEHITVHFRYWDRNLARERIIDIAWPAESQSRLSYGHWRRLNFVLLDAMLAFYADVEPVERRVSSVSIAGGWFNGIWQENGRFELTKIDSGPEKLVAPVHPFAPFPLDARPATWRFDRGFEGAREGNIRMKSHASDSSEDLPVADLSDPISKQLAEVPRCVSTAGDILFFHRVVPFLGPEYAPGLEYGLYAEGYALMVSDFHASLRGLPIRVDPGAKRETAIVWIDGTRFGHLPPKKAILHPMLRERLLFSGVDAYTAMRDIRYDEMPAMADGEHGQEMRFRLRCNHLSLAPLSTGLGFVGIAGYPPFPPRYAERKRSHRKARSLWQRLFG